MSVHFEGFAVGHGDVRLPDWLMKMDISKGAKLTYNVLAICSRGRDYTWSGQEFLAGQISSSIRTVQRHLAELIKHGLIEKGREDVKGKFRRVYRFLTEHHGSKKVSPLKHDKMSLSPPESQKNSSLNTTICHAKGDNLSCSHNKVETIKGKEYTPQPPASEPQIVQLDPACGLAGKAEGLFLESKKEEPEWTAAQKVLEQNLGQGTFRTWIQPLLFERNDFGGIVLRCPNDFFRDWVKNHFTSQIGTAMESMGLIAWELETLTPEQQQADEERKETLEKLQKETARVAASAVAQPDEDVDALPLDEQYERLYKIYPKHECWKDGWKAFRRLYRQKQLPKTSELLQVIKRAKSNNQAWQRDDYRYVPQIHNWLNASRWAD